VEGQNRYWSSHASKRTGIWRDLAIHKRKTEVDRLIAPVIEIAREAGIATPRIARLVAVVDQIEKGQRPLAVQNLSVIESGG